MDFSRYEYFASNDFKDYSFFSDGPNGKIKKLVVYEKMEDDPVIYNLAFGDEDPETGLLLDRIRSDNNDRDVVLITVANTIGDFSDHNNKPMIYIVGSSISRTRLYQMSITKIYDIVNSEYKVRGYINGAWADFQKNVNYEAFVVQKK